MSDSFVSYSGTIQELVEFYFDFTYVLVTLVISY